MGKWVKKLPDGTIKTESINRDECKYLINEECYNLKGYDIDEKRHDSCPIKGMPEKMEPDENDFEMETYADGRNELIDEMFGGI